MGIKRKSRAGLLGVMESQSGNKAPNKTSQAKLPPPLPSLPPRIDLADLKRKRDQRGSGVTEGGKGLLSTKAEHQKGGKQAKVTQTLANKRAESQVGVPT